METLGILAFTLALPALGIAVLTYIRIGDLEKRLKAHESNKPHSKMHVAGGR